MIQKILPISIALFFLISCSETQKKYNSQPIKSLNKLVDELNYFGLQKMYAKEKKKISQKNQLYYEAIIANAFNQPKKSNRLIGAFLTKQNSIDTITKQLLQIKLTNLIHLYEYSKAMQVNEKLQKEYKSLMDSVEREDLSNTHKIWQALKNVPPQKIIKEGDVRLPMVKDKAGLSTISVKFGDSIRGFVFDTGANFSVIQKSVAEELGMKLIPANFNVAAVTGLEVKSDLAIVEKMQLGTLILKNVVFLVFDDETLSFPSINYEIKGIIGFPVIRALEEIRITNKKELFIPKNPINYSLNNLAFDEYMPIVKADFNGDILCLNFDTGAQKTSLYSNFFKKYRQDIESKYKETILKTGGAGGHVTTKGYLLDKINLSIGDGKATLYGIQVFPKEIGETDKLDGNLGQDFIKNFDTMILSFKYSSVLFK